MTQFDLNGNEHDIPGTIRIDKDVAKILAKAKTSKNPAPAVKPQEAPKAPQVPQVPKPNKPADKPVQTPGKADKKPSAAPKSGKVETHLTPAAKAKAQQSLEVITTDIRKETSNIAGAYMRIGFRLWQVREQKLYQAVEVDGKPLKNVYEYSAMAFGFKKSSAINFIAVCEKFSVRDSKDNPTDKIDPSFALFGYTQLSEMLPLSDKELENVKPEMTKLDIRALKSGQPVGQSNDSDDPDHDNAPPAPKATVCYSGMCDTATWDRIIEKLDKLCLGHKIQITVEK